jgi:hypothetical protein
MRFRIGLIGAQKRGDCAPGQPFDRGRELVLRPDLEGFSRKAFEEPVGFLRLLPTAAATAPSVKAASGTPTPPGSQSLARAALTSPTARLSPAAGCRSNGSEATGPATRR